MNKLSESIPDDLRLAAAQKSNNIAAIYIGSDQYFIAIKPGFCVEGKGHAIRTKSVSVAVAEMQNVIPCTCAHCTRALIAKITARP